MNVSATESFCITYLSFFFYVTRNTRDIDVFRSLRFYFSVRRETNCDIFERLTIIYNGNYFVWDLVKGKIFINRIIINASLSWNTENKARFRVR